MFYELKKKLFKYNMVNDYGNKLYFNDRNFEMITTKEGAQFFNGKDAISPVFTKIKTYNHSYYFAFTNNSTVCYINPDSEIISPELRSINPGNLVITLNGKIGTMDINGNVVESDFNVFYDDNKLEPSVMRLKNKYDYIYAKNQLGKVGAIDKKFKEVCPFVFDEPTFDLDAMHDTRESLLRITYKGDTMLMNKDGDIVFQDDPDNIPESLGHSDWYSSYNENLNTSKVYKYNLETKKLDFISEITNYVVAHKTVGNDVYFVTIDPDNHYGISSVDNKNIVENKYYSIESEFRNNKDAVCFVEPTQSKGEEGKKIYFNLKNKKIITSASELEKLKPNLATPAPEYVNDSSIRNEETNKQHNSLEMECLAASVVTAMAVGLSADNSLDNSK